jgi:hypothetical protein
LIDGRASAAVGGLRAIRERIEEGA